VNETEWKMPQVQGGGAKALINAAKVYRLGSWRNRI